MRKSLYAQYVAEREQQIVFEYARGFVGYSVEPDHVFLQDLFVVLKYRHQRVGEKLLQYVERKARELGKERVYVSVVPSTRLGPTMYQLALKYGYKLSHSHADSDYFVKEV